MPPTGTLAIGQGATTARPQWLLDWTSSSQNLLCPVTTVPKEPVGICLAEHGHTVLLPSSGFVAWSALQCPINYLHLGLIQTLMVKRKMTKT